MKVCRNFQPQSYLELISDYAYIVIDDELNSYLRKQTKIHLFQSYIPRIYNDAMPLLLKEARSSPLRSLILISATPQIDIALYKQFDFKVFNDDEIVKLLGAIDSYYQVIKQYISSVFGPYADVYHHRLKLRQVQLAIYFYDLFYSSTLQYYQFSDDVKNEMMQPIAEQLKQYNLMYASCLKNTFYSNQQQALKSYLQVLQIQQFNYQASSNFLQVQDFEQLFSPKQLEALECKQTLWNHSMHFITQDSKCYNPVQLQFPLCDDPTKPWFYINDARINYNTPVDNLPYGRLLIYGNYLKQPSCILQNVALSEGAEELSYQYQSFETSIAKACHAVSYLLVSATKHSKRVLTLIEDEIKQIKDLEPSSIELNYYQGDFSLKQEDVYRDQVETEVDNFLLYNSVLLNEIGYDRRRLPCYARYQEIREEEDASLAPQDRFIKHLCDRLVFPINAAISRNWLIDYDEMFTVRREFNGQSPVSLYTQEPTIRPAPSDDVIIIRPKYVQTQYLLTIGRNTRHRTTYEMVVLIAQFLSLISQVDPLPKRPYMHKLVFSEQLARKCLFVPHEVVEQCEQERLHLYQQEQGKNDVKTAIQGTNNRYYYEFVVSRIYQISSRDKFAKAKVVEDYNPGDCAVCNMRFDSYKNHIYSQDHLRNYRNLMQQNENMIMELQKFYVKYEVIQACNTQLHAVACTLAAEMNCSYAQAVTAINEALRAIGGYFYLDPEDAPRASSPSCKSNNFVHWREDYNLKRQSLLESILTTAQSRKSGYKRIKSCAGTFVVSVLGIEQNRRRCIEEYLNEQFLLEKNCQDAASCQLNLLDYMYYQYIEEPDSFEKGYVRLLLRNYPQYFFHKAGYDKILSIAYITLLCRAMQGYQLSAEMQHSIVFDIEEDDTREDAYYNQVTNYLSDCFPYIDGNVYKTEVQRLQEQRKKESSLQRDKQQKSDSLSVMKLDVKTLKQELADVEIGHIPKTDCIVNIARTILQIYTGKKVSTTYLYNLAVQQFKNQAISGLSEKLKAPLTTFVQTGEIQDITALVNTEEENEDSCELVPEPARVKLPQFSIFDPLIQRNQEMAAKVETMLTGQQTHDEDAQFSDLMSAVAYENAPEVAVSNHMRIVDQASIYKIFNKTAQILALPLSFLVYHERDGLDAQNSTTPAQYAQLQPVLDDLACPLGDSEADFAAVRSASCRRDESSSNKLQTAPRANSVCSRNCQLDPDCISLRAMRSKPYIPQYSHAAHSTSNAQMLTVGTPETNKYFEQIAEKYVNQPPPSTVYRLSRNGVNLTAAPLLSTSLSHGFYANQLSPNFREQSAQYQYNELSQFIPLSKAQVQAIYATLATVFGGFGSVIEISVQFWKSSADALLGSSASICTYYYQEDSYGLNIADIASTTLVALAARAKLLQDKVDHMKRERQLHVASKQVQRCIPPEGVVDYYVISDAFRDPEECDVHVVENGRFERGLDCDVCLGGIYALNGYECD